MVIVAVALPAEAAIHSPLSSSLLAMCGDSDGCSLWQFQGEEATASWKNGAVAHLRINRFDASTNGSVAIQRQDHSGSLAGLTAAYSGTRKGIFIEGEVVWEKNGRPGGKVHWLGIVLQDIVHAVPSGAESLIGEPSYFNSCEESGCAVWNLAGSKAAINGNAAGPSQMSVERFGEGIVAIRRKEVGGTLKWRRLSWPACMKRVKAQPGMWRRRSKSRTPDCSKSQNFYARGCPGWRSAYAPQ